MHGEIEKLMDKQTVETKVTIRPSIYNNLRKDIVYLLCPYIVGVGCGTCIKETNRQSKSGNCLIKTA